MTFFVAANPYTLVPSECVRSTIIGTREKLTFCFVSVKYQFVFYKNLLLPSFL